MKSSNKKNRRNAQLRIERRDMRRITQGRDSAYDLDRSFGRERRVSGRAEGRSMERIIEQEIQEEIDTHYLEPMDSVSVVSDQQEIVREVLSMSPVVELQTSIPVEMGSIRFTPEDFEINKIVADRGWNPAVANLFVLTRDNIELDVKTRAQLLMPDVKADEIYEAIKFGNREGWAALRSKEF